MSKRDYYEILEVSVTASFEEIKSAYRVQARKYHPDFNPGDDKAESLFKEVNEAFEVLKDAEKRAAYDQFGHAAFDSSGGGAPRGFDDLFGAGVGDIFEQMFGGGRSRQKTRGDDISVRISVTLEEAFKGIERTVTIHSPVSCDACHGTGSQSDKKPTTCTQCRGRGAVRMQNGIFITEHPCPQCQGTGSIVEDPCPQCSGNGIFEDQREITINIPAGIEDQSRLRLAGKGNPGLHGLPSGDLIVSVFVSSSKHFERDGDDLHHVLKIPMTLAALGGTADIKGIDDEKVDIVIPAGSQTGDIIKVRGAGFSIYNSKHRGKLNVHLRVMTPQKLTAKQKELLKEFLEEEDNKTDSILDRVKDSFTKKKN